MEKTSTKKRIKNPKAKSRLGLAFASILSAGTLAGACVCFWQVNVNKTESSDFANSINARIKVNATAFEPEGERTYEKAKANVASAASTLSQWLKDSGQENYDVSYESYVDPESSDVFSTYLNAKFTVEKIQDKKPTSKEEEKNKIDNDPYLSIFSKVGFNTNTRSLVYRWYIPNDSKEGATPRFSIVNFDEQIFSIPKDIKKQDNRTKIISDKDGKWGVMYHIQDNKLLNAIYNDMVKAYKYTQEKTNSSESTEPNAKTIDNWCQPRFYIINNLEGLVNEANYHLMNYVNHNFGSGDLSWYIKRYSGTEYETFAKSYIEKDDKGSTEAHKSFTSLGDAKVNTKIDPTGLQEGDFTSVKNYDILRHIDGKSKVGTLDYSGFMSKYVEKIVTIDSKNWQTMFPAKITDEYKNDVDDACSGDETKTKLQYMWFGFSTKDLATDYLSKQIKYKLPVKIENVDIGATGSHIDDKFAKFKVAYSTTNVKPKFIDTIFGGNNVAGWLSLGFLAFLVALLIILACLYRITGVFSWICMMFMLSLTQLLATLSVSVISMSTLFGLFAVAIVGFAAAIAICERIKRRINCNEDTQVAVIKGLKKSTLPVLDLSVISLIFGITLTYIAPIALNVLGLMLTIGGFGIFIFEYLFNGLLHLLTFNNNITINKFNLIGKHSNKANEMLKSNSPIVPKNLDATKLNFDYYTSNGARKFNLFTKKTWIALAALAGVMIVGFVLMGVFGFVTNTMYHSSTCVAIYYEKSDLLTQSWFVQAKLPYSYYRNYDNWWFFFTSNNIDAALTQLSTHLTQGDTLLIQNIVGNTNIDILNRTILAVIIASIVLCVYGCARFNIASVVPMIFGSFVMPLLILSVTTIFQVKYDQTVVLGLTLVCILNIVSLFNTMTTIQGAWSRRDAYTREQLRFIINSSYKMNSRFTWVSALAFFILITTFSITSPNVPLNISIIGLIVVMLVGGAVSFGVTPFSVAYLQYFFLGFRNNILARQAKRKEGKIVVNYDNIDEQLIEGVNKFTKVKQIPLYESWKKKNDKNSTTNIQ